MKIKIYENFGVLGHDKEAVYATAPAEIYNELIVDFGENVEVWENPAGEIVVKDAYSDAQMLYDSLVSRDDKPYLRFINKDNGSTYIRKIEVLQRIEH